MDGRALAWALGPIPGLIYEIKEAYQKYKYGDSQSLANKVQNGEITAENALSQIASQGLKTTPEVDSYLSSMMANQRTEEARAYETEMANTDLLRAAEQLGALGLSPNNVLSVGGSATPNVAAASTPSIQNANQRFDRNISMTNALLGVGSRLASAGIYGSTLRSVNAASQKMAAASAHSARVIRNYDKFGELTGSTEITGVNSKHLEDILR